MKQNASGALCYKRLDGTLQPLTEAELQEEAEQTLAAAFSGLLPLAYAEKRLELLHRCLLSLIPRSRAKGGNENGRRAH
jgi:hypothetical protein